MGINAHTYTQSQFFSDVQAYIRFKTPELTIDELLDENNALSPLTRTAQLYPQLHNNDDPTEFALKSFERELKLLGCAYRVHLRERIQKSLTKETTGSGIVEGDLAFVSPTDGRPPDINATAHLLNQVGELLEAFRKALEVPVTKAAAPLGPVSELILVTDEYLSLTTEAFLTLLLEHVDHWSLEKNAEIRARLAERLSSERKHRKTMRYHSARGARTLEEETSRWVYRRSALKKFFSSVLFLEVRSEPEATGRKHIAAAAAAGVAMLFSVLALAWTQSHWSLNTIPFIGAVVLSYVLKDRIKDGLKHYLSHRFASGLFDQKTSIQDPLTQETLGHCRELFSFKSPENVPKNIWRARHGLDETYVEPQTKPENVIRYLKSLSLNTTAIEHAHKRLGDINDIIRIDLSSFLSRMDHPMTTLKRYDPEDDRVVAIDVPRSYHLSLVMQLQAQGHVVRTERFRIVLAKNGIREVHYADSNCPFSLPPHLPKVRQQDPPRSSTKTPLRNNPDAIVTAK